MKRRETETERQRRQERDRQTDRQTERQTETDTHTEGDRERVPIYGEMPPVTLSCGAMLVADVMIEFR